MVNKKYQLENSIFDKDVTALSRLVTFYEKKNHLIFVGSKNACRIHCLKYNPNYAIKEKKIQWFQTAKCPEAVNSISRLPDKCIKNQGEMAKYLEIYLNIFVFNFNLKINDFLSFLVISEKGTLYSLPIKYSVI